MELPNVGRKRGEMERVEKVMTRIRSGVIHPRDAGIPHVTAQVLNLNKAQVFFNGKHKNGRIQHGVPDEVWLRDTTTHPLRKLEPGHMGVFMPAKYATMIRQGHADKTLEGTTYRFHNEVFGRLGAGYRLAIAFDPGEPQAGAEVYNLETGSRNIDRHSPNAWICHAELEIDSPLYGYSPEVAEATRRKKKHTRAFQSAYAGTGLFGKGAGRAIERREADGRLIRMETNIGDAGGTDRPVRVVPYGRNRIQHPHQSNGPQERTHS